MVRPHTQLHPARKPAPLLPAATLLLLRDGPQGVEVLMTRRSMQASFAPGAYVFPGGGVEPSDHACHDMARHRPTQSALQRTQAIAAIRESFEELGVLLAWRPDGSMAQAADLARLNRHQPLHSQLASLGMQLAADQVFWMAHWVTDRDLKRRFDVPFLVARMPEGQEPVADDHEQFEPLWVRPVDALTRHRQNDFFIIFPTIRTLERLQSFDSVQAVLQACAAEQPWFHSCPRAGWLRGQESRHMEHEPPFGELALTCPDGQIVHTLDWQTDQPVRLLRHVQRLTAPNPGVMTGPGTNSYLVGDLQSGFVVIDPGPADASHVQRLWQACEGQIRFIVCTHSHPDHSPGAALLQTLCKRDGVNVPIMGMASAPTARVHSRFQPDHALHDGDQLVLHAGDDTHTLRMVHTPGHAANHLCVCLVEDGLLFSGDHVLNGSTTVVDPPDGHMGDYLASLDKLAAICHKHQVAFILPAHGHVLGNLWGEPHSAVDVIAKLKAHRLARDAKVRQAMAAKPQGTPDDWLPMVYDDVPSALWPVAMRSLLAHVALIKGG
jgi:glyoxylase-like metal-dependent hydrolase (beta-lactamase superfamily II)/8-oxo-dGTP pyrophosphatase MutT (NUDIX family)